MFSDKECSVTARLKRVYLIPGNQNRGDSPLVMTSFVSSAKMYFCGETEIFLQKSGILPTTGNQLKCFQVIEIIIRVDKYKSQVNFVDLFHILLASNRE